MGFSMSKPESASTGWRAERLGLTVIINTGFPWKPSTLVYFPPGQSFFPFLLIMGRVLEITHSRNPHLTDSSFFFLLSECSCWVVSCF
jgi:hypothetical protein